MHCWTNTHNSNMPEQDKHSNTKQLVLAMCIPSKLSGNECALWHFALQLQKHTCNWFLVLHSLNIIGFLKVHNCNNHKLNAHVQQTWIFQWRCPHWQTCRKLPLWSAYMSATQKHVSLHCVQTTWCQLGLDLQHTVHAIGAINWHPKRIANQCWILLQRIATASKHICKYIK